jgi:hypothetical protein
LPPNFTVSGPGEAMEPRVPQNFTYIAPVPLAIFSE